MGRPRQLKLIDNEQQRKVTYRKRKEGVKKKCKELSILCNVPVLLVCYCLDGNGTVETYPDDKQAILDIYSKYCSFTGLHQDKYKHNLKKMLNKVRKRIRLLATGDVTSVSGSPDGVAVAEEEEQDVVNSSAIIQPVIDQFEHEQHYHQNSVIPMEFEPPPSVYYFGESSSSSEEEAIDNIVGMGDDDEVQYVNTILELGVGDSIAHEANSDNNGLDFSGSWNNDNGLDLSGSYNTPIC